MTSAADDIVDLYSRRAADWITDRGQDLFEKPWLDRFAALIAPGGTILDIGCGSGEPIARYFIGQGSALTGVNSSPRLIDHCRTHSPQQEWICTDMRGLSLSRTFAGVIAWHSFFHLSPHDQRAMFPVFTAHAAPGAPLMFTSGPSHGEVVGAFHGEPLYHGSLDPSEYHALLESAGFELIDHVVNDPTCGHSTIWLARRV